MAQEELDRCMMVGWGMRAGRPLTEAVHRKGCNPRTEAGTVDCHHTVAGAGHSSVLGVQNCVRNLADSQQVEHGCIEAVRAEGYCMKSYAVPAEEDTIVGHAGPVGRCMKACRADSAAVSCTMASMRSEADRKWEGVGRCNLQIGPGYWSIHNSGSTVKVSLLYQEPQDCIHAQSELTEWP